MSGQQSVELEVEIERILPGGMGLAHAEGQTIFVSLAAPGDRLRVKIDRRRGKLAFASIVEILRPSTARIEAPCPYFGRCGGCDFQQLNYDAQLAAKSEIIRDCLRRIAHIDNPPEVRVLGSPNEWRYRARANWQVNPTTRKIGYYERGTREVCDVAECAVLAPEVAQVLTQVRLQVASGAAGNLTEIEVVAGDSEMSLSPAFAGFKTQAVNRRVGDEDYDFTAESFFQTNHELLEALVQKAVGQAGGQNAVDLYCGVGLFTLPLARRFDRVVAVESNPNASKYAVRNVSHAGLENVSVVTSKVSDWLGRHASSYDDLDFLLLDPPRTGAEPNVIQIIVNLRPHHISYVSCDPATLARDLKELLEGGYRIDSIAAFDMFPQTHHVEMVVHLAKD